MSTRNSFEKDKTSFPAEAYAVKRCNGVAHYVLGWELSFNQDSEFSGEMERTGRVVVVMAGDDRSFTCDVDDLSPLDREKYCGECGQIGCSHDGLER